MLPLGRQVLDSDYRRKKMMSGKHIPIGTWLDALNMAEYIHLFHQYGGVEDLIYATEAEIKDLGIRNGGHRAKIVSSLRILRDKYEKGRVTGSGVLSLQRTSSTTSSAPNSPTTPYQDFQHVIASPEKLDADLQKELAGDPFELRSRSWYHGNISRQRAESIVINNGDFLVRDCISKPGDFVLTCRWKGIPLNFMINSIVGDCAPGNLPTISYQFEEDCFLTIQQLIHYYQQNGKPVTVVSGAILKHPIPRSMPLSYYDTKYGALTNSSSGTYATPSQTPKSSPFITPFESPESSPEMNRRKVKWTGSQPLLNIADKSEDTKNRSQNRKRDSRSSSLDRCDSVPIINVTTPSGHPEPESTNYLDGSKLSKPMLAHMRAGSVPVLTSENVSNENEASKFSTIGRRRLAPASSESQLTNPAPPKPSRIPSIKYKQKPTVIIRKDRDDDDDRDYSDYTQVKEEPSWLHGSVESLPKFQDDSSRKLSSSPTPDQPQKGRRATLVHRDKIFIASQGSEQSAPNMNTSTVSSSTNLQKGRTNLNSRVPPINPDQFSPSQTYQIVARSRSFQTTGHDDTDYDNNFDTSENKGYKTLPSKSSKAKTRQRLISNTQFGKTDQIINDYDYPKEHAIDDSDIFGFQNVEYMKSRKITTPSKVCLSLIMPETFKSSFLPKGHKVLDKTVLLNAKALILNKTPKVIALHITKYDLSLLTVTDERDLGLGVTSGLELITLYQGKQLRQDVIERWNSLRMFAMVTLITSQTVNERAKILSLWILTCLELKTTCGNLFSFAAIMAALTCPQIIRLTDTWLILRQNYTASAYIFDTKMRPGYLTLNDASSDLPLNNICVPYITPVCQLLEIDVESILQDYYWEKGLDPIGSAIDVLLTHLDTARIIASQGNLYRITGQALMTVITSDTELDQILCPEFHLLVLWGEKGWMVKRKDRIDKMEQILTLLSQKCQVPGDDGTEV